jgi:fructose 1,6-bisphosphate aldolase/phosphatase
MRTLSLIKADVGSTAGHLKPTNELIEGVEEEVSNNDDILDDWFVFNVGDDVDILMSHTEGKDNDEIHQLAWNAFKEGTEIAKEQGLYGAGQDLLKDAFSGNVKGLGPGVCEIQFEERQSEPILIFGADKTEPGAFNQPMYTTFADPVKTSGLILKDTIHKGFTFDVMDLTDTEGRIESLDVPEDSWDLVALLMEPHSFSIEKISSRHNNETVASISTQRLHNVAGEYVGKDDPVAIVRTQKNFPSPGEVVQPFANPPFVAGAMRGSHHGVLYPITSDEDEMPSFYDGPPLVQAIGFTLNEGKLSDPVYPFDSSFWDSVRNEASNRFVKFRNRQGAFGPGTVSGDELEYGGRSDITENLDFNDK